MAVVISRLVRVLFPSPAHGARSFPRPGPRGRPRSSLSQEGGPCGAQGPARAPASRGRQLWAPRGHSGPVPHPEPWVPRLSHEDVRLTPPVPASPERSAAGSCGRSHTGVRACGWLRVALPGRAWVRTPRPQPAVCAAELFPVLSASRSRVPVVTRRWRQRPPRSNEPRRFHSEGEIHSDPRGEEDSGVSVRRCA